MSQSVTGRDDIAGRRDAMLDGLRGLAVLAVVYVHYSFYSGLMTAPGSGFLGVAVFFVLSGYLITRIVWRGCDYWAFVKRRAQRLYPALLGLVLVGTPLMAAVGPEGMGDHVLAALAASFQVTAFASVLGAPTPEPWVPAWSLSVEWTFYLLWPLMLSVLARRRLSALQASRVTGIMALALYVLALPLSPLAFGRLPVANLGVMLIGASLALVHQHRLDTRSPLKAWPRPDIALFGLVVFVALVLTPGPGSAHPLYRWVLLPLAVVAAYVIIDQHPSANGPARRLLQAWPLRALGTVSYSVYLWHVPVLWIVWFALPDVTAWGRVAIALIALVPAVGLSFTLLERPWLPHRPAILASDKNLTPA